jgi:ABC-type nitrate/sulfonate/bicarbonate transport system substrate-binding protein
MTTRLDVNRRTFLLGSLSAAAVAGLAACGSSSSKAAPAASGSASSAKAFGPLTLQLDWLQDVEFGGDYLAHERGYAKDAGFSDFIITAGGPAISSEPAVTSGKAFLGYSVPDLVAQANAGGADLRIIGATLKKNPYVIMSLASDPYATPESLIGKKVAVDTQNNLAFKSFLQANGVDPSKVTVVPANFDPSLLSSKQVDAYLAYFNSEPITLATTGTPVHVMAFEDFKLPSIGDVYIVKASSISKDRDKVKAALTVALRGWQDYARKNSDAVPLTIALAGKASTATPEFWQKEADVTRDYLIADAADDGGLLIMSADHQQKIIDSLALGGVKTTVADLFDMSVIKEVFDADSSLAAVPTPAAS